MPADDAARAPVGRPAWGGAAQRLGPAPSGIREALEAGGADRLRESSHAAQPETEGAWGGPPPACRWPGGAAALIAAGGEAPRAPRAAAPAAEGLSALLAEARRSRPDISGVLSALCASRNDSLLSGILTKACVVVAPQVQGSWDVVPSAPTAGTHGVRVTALRKHASLMRTTAAARATRAGGPDWLCWTARVRALQPLFKKYAGWRRFVAAGRRRYRARHPAAGALASSDRRRAPLTPGLRRRRGAVPGVRQGARGPRQPGAAPARQPRRRQPAGGGRAGRRDVHARRPDERPAVRRSTRRSLPRLCSKHLVRRYEAGARRSLHK